MSGDLLTWRCEACGHVALSGDGYGGEWCPDCDAVGSMRAATPAEWTERLASEGGRLL